MQRVVSMLTCPCASENACAGQTSAQARQEDVYHRI
ncbi:hypothetical protein SeGA_3597, partial [Salmonella enterica subsp. enterica serovar Gaminara str. A4-567]